MIMTQKKIITQKKHEIKASTKRYWLHKTKYKKVGKSKEKTVKRVRKLTLRIKKQQFEVNAPHRLTFIQRVPQSSHD